MRSLLTVLRDPVAWVLVIAGVVELLSGGTAARGAILFAGAALILADRVRISLGSIGAATPPLPAAPLQRAVASTRWIAPVLIAALVVPFFEVHTMPTTAVVGFAGVLAVGWAWLTEPGGPAGAAAPWRGLLVWGGVFLALGLWELRALLGQPSLDETSYDSPTISYLLEPVLDTYAGRAGALGLWILAGRSLIKRS